MLAAIGPPGMTATGQIRAGRRQHFGLAHGGLR